MSIRTLLLSLLAAVGVLAAAEPPQDVTAALARMDQSSVGFHSMSADVVMQQYTKLLDDKDTQQGTMQMQRDKTGTVRAILTFPEKQTLAFLGRELQIYYPQTGELQKYKASDFGNALNQFLLLGFGSSGRDLQRSYDITADGTERVGGKTSVKLILVPKDKAVAQKLPKAELWVPEDTGYPVQQQFWEATSGNYRLLTYSDIKINPPINGNLEFKAPAGAKKKRK